MESTSEESTEEVSEEDSDIDLQILRREPRRVMPWDTSEEEEEIAVPTQYQIDSFFGRPASWEEFSLFNCVYIDDLNVIEKVRIKNSAVHITSNKQKVYVNAPKTETRFRKIRELAEDCLLYTSPSPRDLSTSRMPSSA